MTRYLLAAIALAGVSLSDAQSPAFEIASIRPNRSGARNSGFRRAAPGALNATNVTLKMLITFAYDIRDYQLTGGPNWFDSERYDVLAKPANDAQPGVATSAEKAALLRLRVQALLADRFQLTLHRTTKELPTYALVPGKNGPKLDQSPGLNKSTSSEFNLVTNGHHLSCNKTSMASLAKIFLEGELGRSVMDKTGLQGEFDFTLDWAPDVGQRKAPEDSGAGSEPNAEGASLFTALQEQLGLKLEPQKGPVEILVIDRAERASEN